MDTSFNIPAIYMLTGRNTSGADKNLWHYIDWSAVTSAVKSLQVRLAKESVQNKKWRKVKSLQWLVNHSLAAKLLSVKRVTEKRTSNGFSVLFTATAPSKWESGWRFERVSCMKRKFHVQFLGGKAL